eukprot:15112817-Alexandrium_andersonii.AAC.1
MGLLEIAPDPKPSDPRYEPPNFDHFTNGAQNTINKPPTVDPAGSLRLRARGRRQNQPQAGAQRS